MKKEILKDYSTRAKNADNFYDYLEEFRDDVINFIIDNIKISNNPDLNKYLYYPFLDFCRNGGKCHRALICIAACAIFSDDISKTLKSAISIEIFQNAALIHDDISDNSIIRRGKPTLHTIVGKGQAINIGDFALNFTNDLILNDENLQIEEKLNVLNYLNMMKKNTIEGQSLDIGYSSANLDSIDEIKYLDLATRKTAYYSCAYPLLIGAYLGGAKPSDMDCLFEFGKKVGLAFQIQDDILNLEETSSEKKDLYSDIREGKLTLILVDAINQANIEDKDTIVKIYNSTTKTDSDIELILQLFDQYNSISYAKQFANNLIEEAQSDLINSSICDNHFRKLVFDMSNWMKIRLK